MRESLFLAFLHLLDVWIPGQFLVQFDAHVGGDFFLGEFLVVDSEFEGLFGVGEGEASRNCLLTVDGDTPVRRPFAGAVEGFLHSDCSSGG